MQSASCERLGEAWHCTGGSDQDDTQRKKMQKGEMLSEQVL